MNNNQLPLVTDGQARRLKKVGFNIPCSMYYTSTGRTGQYGYLYDDNQQDEGCSAPTVALALKWIRDVKGLPNAVETDFYTGRDLTRSVTYFGRYTQGIAPMRTAHFNQYEAAESALLDELLTLIEND